MNHSFTAEGFGIRHRPVRLDDAAFLVGLRNLEHAKGNVGDSASDVASQEDWITTYFEREGDYYFVVETTCGIPVGAFGIYDVTGASAEIGRWIIQPRVPATLPGIIPGLDLAFGQLGLHELRTRVVSTNRRVIKLDQHLGFKISGIEPAAMLIGGKSVDLVHMNMQSETWPIIRNGLLPAALMQQVQLRKWEETSGILSHQPAQE